MKKYTSLIIVLIFNLIIYSVWNKFLGFETTVICCFASTNGLLIAIYGKLNNTDK